MIVKATISVDKEDHTITCCECLKSVMIENASARIIESNRFVFLCGECDMKDRNAFSMSANYNLCTEA